MVGVTVSLLADIVNGKYVIRELWCSLCAHTAGMAVLEGRRQVDTPMRAKVSSTDRI